MSMWYDVNTTLSYNKLFNFVVGPRGVGKTYSCKRRVIKNFLRDGAQFVYLRRYETEMKHSQMNNFFNDICQEFPGHTFEYKCKTFFCDGEIIGWAIPLSRAAQYKSVPFPNVTVIIFDEFIIDQGLIRYLNDEVQCFNEMYSTIARLRDVTVLFLSNAITFINPYFLYFDLPMPTGTKKIKTKGDILIQLVDNPEYKDASSSTRFGKIIQGTDYAKYSIDNEFLRDTDTFVSKMPAGLNCRAILLVDGVKLGVYTKLEDWWISESYDDTCQARVAVKISEHNEDTTLKLYQYNRIFMEELQQRYYRGMLRFSSIKAKNLIANHLLSIGSNIK